MRSLLSIAMAACALGCKSQDWTVEVVDGGGGRDAGAFLWMDLYLDGQAKKLALVYEDRTAGRIRVATREGSGSSWDPDFVVQNLSSTPGQMPSAALGPDGSVWAVFAYPDPARLASQNEVYPYEVYSAVPAGAGSWQTELVTTNALPRDLHFIESPPSIAYSPAAGDQPVFAVWSTPHGDALVHAVRAGTPAGAWSPARLGGEGSEFVGVRPAAVASRATGSLRIFYGDESPVQSTPLAVLYPTPLGWGGPLPTGFGLAGSLGRFQAKEILHHPKDLPAGVTDELGIVVADCDGKPLYRSSVDGPPAQWSPAVAPGIPTDPERDFCEPSFAHDFQGHLWLSAFDYDYRGPVVFHEDHNLGQWLAEYPESGLSETGRFTSLVYDPTADEMIVAWYDEGAGQLKIARRDAQSKP